MRKKQKLLVELDGKRRYISVPEGRANELHNYLRSHRVRSSPPAPSFTGFDSIELGHNVDVRHIQSLLNEFV